MSASATAVVVTGLVIGVAAAVSGITSHRFAGFPPWELLVLAALALAFVSRGSRLASLRLRWVDGAFATYIGLRLILELINQIDLARPGLYTAALQPAFFAMVYLSARLMVTDVRELRLFLTGLAGPAVPSAALAVVQLAGVGSVNHFVERLTASAALAGRAASGNLVRASGLVGQWTDFGSYMCGVIAVLMLLVWINRKNSLPLKRISVTLGAAVIAALATLTFAVVAAAAAVIVLSLRTQSVRSVRIPRRVIALCLVVIAACSPFLVPAISHRLSQEYVGTSKSLSHSSGLIPESLEFRLTVWEHQTLPAIWERPLTGWGQGVYTQFRTWTHQPTQLVWPYAESQWFDQLMTGGVLECTGLIFLLIAAYRELGRGLSGAGRPLRVLIVVMSIVGLTVPCFTDVGLPVPFWAAVGGLLSVCAARDARNSGVDTGVAT